MSVKEKDPLNLNNLSRGIVDWMKFEVVCGRSHIFSERILAYPIGNILAIWYGKQFSIQ